MHGGGHRIPRLRLLAHRQDEAGLAALRAGRPGLLDHVHHDGLGRVVSVLAPDNASTATYTYADNLTTVTDPAGKWKTFTTSFTCTPGTATAG